MIIFLRIDQSEIFIFQVLVSKEFGDIDNIEI
jgi:hypothetical protein